MTSISSWGEAEIDKACLSKDTYLAMLHEFDKAYWLDHSSLVDDRTYNKLKERYIARYGTEGLGVGMRVTIPAEKEVELTEPMRSLDNVFTRKEFDTWCKRLNGEEMVLEPKMDGLAVRIHYRLTDPVAGVYTLHLVNTRGDGEVGENVTTAFIRRVHSASSEVLADELGKSVEELGDSWHVDAEVYCTIPRFEEYINRSGAESYPTARHLASAGLRSTTAKPDVELSMAVYGVCSSLEPLWGTETALRETWRRAMPFVDILCCTTDYDALWRVFSSATSHEKLEELGYPTDGMVLKINDLAERRYKGYTTHHPKGAVALKVEDAALITKVTGITYNCSGSGKQTPVVNVEPIVIGGVTVTKANLHNLDHVRSYNFAVGDDIGLVLAGDIIPDVVDVRRPELIAERGSELAIPLPTRCAGCGGPLSTISRQLYCADLDACTGTAARRLYRGTCRDALDIDGIGEEITEWLVLEFDVYYLYQLYELFVPESRDEILESYFRHYKRRGEKVVDGLYAAIEKSRIVGFHRVLYALFIPGIGIENAKELARCFKGMEDLLTAFSGQDYPLVPEVRGVTSAVLSNWFKTPKNALQCRALDKVLTITPYQKAANAKTVCFTGSHPVMTRWTFSRNAIAKGWEVSDRLNRSVDVLVVCDAKAGAVKKALATKYGIRMIDAATWEDELSKS